MRSVDVGGVSGVHGWIEPEQGNDALHQTLGAGGICRRASSILHGMIVVHVGRCFPCSIQIENAEGNESK